MQSTSVQMKTRAAQGTRPQSTGAVKDKSCNPEFMDPFLQMIISLLTQQQEQGTQQQNSGSGAAGSDQMSALTALFQSSPGGMTVLQNMLLHGEPNTAALMQMQTELEASAGTSFSTPIAVGTGATAVPPIFSEQTGPPPEVADMLSLPDSRTDNAGTTVRSSDVLTQMTDLPGLSGGAKMQTALNDADIEVTCDGLVSTQSGLSEAAAKAKQMLAEQAQQQPDEQDDIDIDKLQNELAKTDKAAPFELRFKAAGKAADAQVLDQIAAGIKQNISAGKSEFVVKLKPEALGEITVKLVEEAGKTTLSITTAKALTAKLINDDLDALREAVAPMKIEVRHAVASANETAGGSMQQFNMAGQQFAGEQFSGSQNFFRMPQAASGQTGNQTVDDAYESSQAVQAKFSPGDRLDAYI